MYRVWIEFSDVVSLLGPGGAACDVLVWIEERRVMYRVWIEFSDVVSLLGPGGAACDVPGLD